MSITVKIDCEAADEVTRQNLLDCLINIGEDVNRIGDRLNREGTLPAHEMVNLAEAKKIRKAVRRVLRYFSSPSQWESYNLE